MRITQAFDYRALGTGEVVAHRFTVADVRGISAQDIESFVLDVLVLDGSAAVIHRCGNVALVAVSHNEPEPEPAVAPR